MLNAKRFSRSAQSVFVPTMESMESLIPKNPIYPPIPRNPRLKIFLSVVSGKTCICDFLKNPRYLDEGNFLHTDLLRSANSSGTEEAMCTSVVTRK